MSLPASTKEPQQLVAGDTVAFLKTLVDYPAGDGWSLTYELSGPVNYTFASTADGNSHQLTVAAAITAEWLPGEYSLAGFAVNEDTEERQEIYRGILKLTPNVAAGAPAEQSHARKMLQLVQDVMLKKARHDILESDVEGTRIKRMSPAELREEYTFWKNAVKAEDDALRAKQGLPSRNKILPVFNITGGNVPIRNGWPFQ